MKGVSSNRREHAVVQTRRHVPEMQKNCSLLLHRGALRLFCCSTVARTIERRQIPCMYVLDPIMLRAKRHHRDISIINNSYLKYFASNTAGGPSAQCLQNKFSSMPEQAPYFEPSCTKIYRI
jgi:hypothetical protein